MIEIRDTKDLRPGDILRVWPEGMPDQWIEGPITEVPAAESENSLRVGGWIVRIGHRLWNNSYDINLDKYPAKREPKPLPTEIGSFIFVDEVTSEASEDYDGGFKPTWAYLDEEYGLFWETPALSLRPKQIVAWRPAELREVTA